MNTLITKLALAVKSKTVWLAVILFAINGIGAIKNLIPAQYLPAVDGVLSILTILAHLFPSQDYNQPISTG